MFWVRRVANDNTLIDDLGLMNRNELIDFLSNYIGEDLSQWGIIYRSEKEMLDAIDYIEKYGEEYACETKGTNLSIIYKVGE